MEKQARTGLPRTLPASARGAAKLTPIAGRAMAVLTSTRQTSGVPQVHLHLLASAGAARGGGPGAEPGGSGVRLCWPDGCAGQQSDGAACAC